MKTRTKTNTVLSVFFFICAIVGLAFATFWSTAFGAAAIINMVTVWIPGNTAWREREERSES